MKRFAALNLAVLLSALHAPAAAPERPNILWISIEDTSPWLGFCGDSTARTPVLDALARDGVIYTRAFAPASVCSPVRFSVITGCYPTTYGTQRLRSAFAVPDSVGGFPEHLRRVGYFCTNNQKTDYNTSAEKRIVRASWNECNQKAHWRNRKPGQPFFAIFNLLETHQSRVFESWPEPDIDPAERCDPATVPLPPYYPDIPSARRAMARVYDCIAAADKRSGEILAELESDRLKDDTIVVFWSDHGQGIPRGKRTLWDTGLRVPLFVWFPEKYRHLAPAAPGTSLDRIVSLMDLGPSMLSLAGLPIPPHMQGRAFLGPAAAGPRDFIFGTRDRVDEVLDLVRSYHDGRFLYVRNYMPHLSWNQPEYFSNQLELRRDITRMAAAGGLGAGPLTYAGPAKPIEALYDTDADPWQMRNLAEDPGHRDTRDRLRSALRAWMIETRDLGFLHEGEASRLCEGGRPPVEAARSDDVYPLLRILDTADLVGRPGAASELMRRLDDPNPTVRYWAAVGLRAASAEGAVARDALRAAMDDASPPVRIEAAGALAAQGDESDAVRRLAASLREGDGHARLHAARTLQLLGDIARPALPVMQTAVTPDPALTPDANMFLKFSLEPAIECLARSPSEKRPD